VAAPRYPGYKARECNGCGLCCLTVPCSISAQFGLWRPGKGCRALRFEAGRYWCEAIRNPRGVSVRLARIMKTVRLDCIGVGAGCDHRAAFSIEEALELLATGNLADELAGNTHDSYPRACMLHLESGIYGIFQDAADAEPRIAALPDDPQELVHEHQLTPLSQWSPP